MPLATRTISLFALAALLTACTSNYGPFTIYGGVSYAPQPDAPHDPGTPYAWPTPTQEIAPTAVPTQAGRVCYVRMAPEFRLLRVRSSPAYGDNVIGSVVNGSAVTVYGSTITASDTWYRVNAGWVLGDYVAC